MGDFTVYGPSIEGLLIPGAGLRIYRAPTLLTGTGSELQTPLVVPVALHPSEGKRYRISGVASVRSDAGGRVAHVALRDAILRRELSGWTEIRGFDSVIDTYPGWDAFFATTNDLPGIGFTGGTLQLWANPRSAQTVSVEFHGTIADLGAE